MFVPKPLACVGDKIRNTSRPAPARRRWTNMRRVSRNVRPPRLKRWAWCASRQL